MKLLATCRLRISIGAKWEPRLDAQKPIGCRSPSKRGIYSVPIHTRARSGTPIALGRYSPYAC
jgi:hypothetical protein